MGWERRGGIGEYYYRKVRRGGRVVSQYVGHGKLARLEAQLEMYERQEREEKRKADRKARAEEMELAKLQQEFDELASAITRGYLITRGYHLHKGQWRRKREKDQ